MSSKKKKKKKRAKENETFNSIENYYNNNNKLVSNKNITTYCDNCLYVRFFLSLLRGYMNALSVRADRI